MTGCICAFPDCNGPVDLFVEQGSDWTTTINCIDSNGNPVNLTGASARMQARAYPGQPLPQFSLTSASGGGLVLGGTAGTVVASIPGAQTATLLPALNVPVGFRPTDTLRFLGYYDMLVTSESGALTFYQHGKLIMLMGITSIARPDGGVITLPPT
jgi:hypothetical protein